MKKYTLLSYLITLTKKYGFRSTVATLLFGKLESKRTTIIRIPNTKAIYIALPKCANSSMKGLIAGIVHDAFPDIPYSEQWPPSMFNGDSARELLLESKVLLYHNDLDNYSDHCIFTIVRNPWDRLVSAYTEKIIKYADKPLPGFFNLYGNRFFHGMSFTDFVEAVFSIPDEFANPHFSSQFHLLRRSNSMALIPDRIIKMEAFPDAINNFLQEIGITEYTFPHLLKTQHDNYRDMYTAYTRDLVRKRYNRDVIAFGYDF